MNNPREWWVYAYPEDPGRQQLSVPDDDYVEDPNYPRQRVRLIEWPADAELPIAYSNSIMPSLQTELAAQCGVVRKD